MLTRNFKRAYVWQLPVRIFHWVNALAIIVLSITGFIIANPPAIASSVEATNSYWMGTVRFIHFTSGYVFFFIMLFRLYWVIVGNKFSNLRAFMFFNKKGMKNFFYVLKHDIFLFPEKVRKISNLSIGHNSMAVAAYLFMFFVAVIMVFTGFGLYADNATWWLPKLFNWVPSLLGGDFMTRLIHHICMWIILVISIIHIYLVLYHDWLDGRGEVSSMISGFKFVRKERIDKDIDE